MRLFNELLEMLPPMLFNIGFFVLLLAIAKEAHKIHKDLCKLDEEVHSMTLAIKINQIKKLEKQNDKMKSKFRQKESWPKQENTTENQYPYNYKRITRGRKDSYNTPTDDKQDIRG